MKSIVVLISGGGSNLQAIIEHIDAQQLNVKIALVLSNRADAYGLERAKAAGITTATIDHTHYASRELFDQAMIEQIDPHQPDLIVMAGFMRILSEGFIQHYADRMINIHPSLLPAYKGLHTHKRALADKATHHGATVHYVTVELDAGKPILQGRVPVFDNDDEDTLQQRVHRIEHVIYPEVIQWFSNNRLACHNGEISLDNISLGNPVIIERQPEQH
ncbi:MAG: phosphoribosylglycinamide formyltransferase [Leucothrix sp.]